MLDSSPLSGGIFFSHEVFRHFPYPAFPPYVVETSSSGSFADEDTPSPWLVARDCATVADDNDDTITIHDDDGDDGDNDDDVAST